MSILERRNYYGLKAISGLMKESCHTIIHYFYNELLNYNMSYITICPTLQYVLHYNMSYITIYPTLQYVLTPLIHCVLDLNHLIIDEFTDNLKVLKNTLEVLRKDKHVHVTDT